VKGFRFWWLMIWVLIEAMCSLPCCPAEQKYRDKDSRPGYYDRALRTLRLCLGSSLRLRDEPAFGVALELWSSFTAEGKPPAASGRWLHRRSRKS